MHTRIQKKYTGSQYTQPKHLLDLLNSYYTSGYQRDLERVGEQAIHHLENLGRAANKASIVLDIDETSLMNDWSIINPQKPYNEAAWYAWIMEAAAPPIKPTLAIYQQAQRLGYKVFFITGREEKQREATEKNLRDVGYDTWEHLYMHPGSQENDAYILLPEAATYKTTIRWNITMNGYHIILNIGDQHSDLVGGYADKTIQLPNPFYTII